MLRDALLAEFDHEMGTTRRLLERIPDEKLSWRPHERSRSLGGLGSHIGNLPHWGDIILNSAFFDLAEAPPQEAGKASRAEILAHFDESVRKARACLDKSDAELVSRWALKRGGHEMFSMPKATAFRIFVLYHTVHHRGQLSVYLRLNGVPVPPMYGPTADEG